MKTMGLCDLVLVRPKHFPSDEATARAAGADDVLANARVHERSAAAIADCGLGRRRERAPAHHHGADRRSARGCGGNLAAPAPESRGRVAGPRAIGAHERRSRALPAARAHSGEPGVQLVESRDGRPGALLRAAHGSAEPRRSPQGPGSDSPLATAARARRACTSTSSACSRSPSSCIPRTRSRSSSSCAASSIKATLDYNELNILRGALTSLDPAQAPARAAAMSNREIYLDYAATAPLDPLRRGRDVGLHDARVRQPVVVARARAAARERSSKPLARTSRRVSARRTSASSSLPGRRSRTISRCKASCAVRAAGACISSPRASSTSRCSTSRGPSKRAA